MNNKEQKLAVAKTILSMSLVVGCSASFAEQVAQNPVTNNVQPASATTSTKAVATTKKDAKKIEKTTTTTPSTTVADASGTTTTTTNTTTNTTTAAANGTNAEASKTDSTTTTTSTTQTTNGTQTTTSTGTDAANTAATDPNAVTDPNAATSETAPPIPSLSGNDYSYDPYEAFNRPMFKFNDTLDTYFLKPIATAYNTVMPKPLNQGIHNFFSNLNTLPTIANDILQLNMYQATNDIWRFGVNSTVGVLGFFDIASRIGLPYYNNDFGLTLATWGYKNSNYLVLPFFGPNTPRDGLSIPVDYFAFSVYPYIESESTRYAVYSVGVVDRRAQLLQFQSVYEEAALDKYVFMRNAYMQRRAAQIEDNAHRDYSSQMAKQNGSPVEQEQAQAEAPTPPPSPAGNYDKG